MPSDDAFTPPPEPRPPAPPPADPEEIPRVLPVNRDHAIPPENRPPAPPEQEFIPRVLPVNLDHGIRPERHPPSEAPPRVWPVVDLDYAIQPRVTDYDDWSATEDSGEHQRPHPGFWMSVLWAFVYMLFMNLIALGVAIVVVVILLVASGDWRAYGRAITAKGFLETEDGKQFNALITAPAMIVGQIACVAGALALLRLFAGKGWTRRVGLRLPSISHAAFALLALPGLIIVSTAIHALANKFLWNFNYQEQVGDLFSRWPVWFGILAVGLGPGINEELFCRGFLGRGLVGRYGPFLGVLLTSLFFGIMHLDPPSVVATASLGLMLHFIYLTSRSLWLPICLHALNNSLAVWASQEPFLKELENPSPAQAVLLIIGGTILVLGAGFALLASRVRVRGDSRVENAPWSFPKRTLLLLGGETLVAHVRHALDPKRFPFRWSVILPLVLAISLVLVAFVLPPMPRDAAMPILYLRVFLIVFCLLGVAFVWGFPQLLKLSGIRPEDLDAPIHPGWFTSWMGAEHPRAGSELELVRPKKPWKAYVAMGGGFAAFGLCAGLATIIGR